MKRSDDVTVGLKVRMKEPLRKSLEEAARTRGVSLNAEAVMRLERSFGREELAFVVRRAVLDAMAAAASRPLKDTSGKTTSSTLTMTIAEAARKLGIGRNSAYEAVARNEIPTIRIGRRLLVPASAFEKLLRGDS